MAFADPMIVSDDGTNKSLPRIGQTANQSEYRLEESSGSVIHSLILSHDFGQGAKRDGKGRNDSAAQRSRRAVLRYVREYLVADPLVTNQSHRVPVAATLTMTWPEIITAADAAKRGVTIALLSNAANLLRVANGET